MEAVEFERGLAARAGEELTARLKAIPGVYLVGGIVRDVLLGRPSVDIDAVTVERTPEEVLNALGSSVRAQFTVNDRFQTRRGILDSGAAVDVTGLGHGTLEQDIFRRDFTLNALAVSISENRWLDLTGGEEDLRQRRIRMVSPKNLEDDPLRLLRAVRLKWELGFGLEARTLEAVKRLAPRVTEAAPERIMEELRRMFAQRPAGSIVRDLHKFNLLFALFPEMQPMETHVASPLSKLTVLDHTLLALDACEEILEKPEEYFGEYAERVVEQLKKGDRPREEGGPVPGYVKGDSPLEERSPVPLRAAMLKIALLLHDIAKPITEAVMEGNLTFYGHDQAGALLAGKVLERYRFAADHVKWVETVIRGHLRIGFYSNEKEINPKKIYKYFKEFGDAGIALIVHSLADLRGYDFDFLSNPWGQNQPEIIRALLEAYFEKNKLMVSPPKLVKGKDLIEMGYTPGPAFSVVLGKIEEAQVEGRVKTREEALALARRLFEEVGVSS